MGSSSFFLLPGYASGNDVLDLRQYETQERLNPDVHRRCRITTHGITYSLYAAPTLVARRLFLGRVYFSMAIDPTSSNLVPQKGQ